MKTYLLLLAFLGFTALTGCSADDLAGPDTAADEPIGSAQTLQDEAVRSSRPLSLAGAWRTSDRLGSITLFIDEARMVPSTSPSAAQTFEGKGIISGLLEAPMAVSVEGQYKERTITFSLTSARGETIAKAQGEIARDFSLIKVVLLDASGNERELVFDRF